MKREYGLEQVARNPASVVTEGTFDGVHVGHQAIIRYLIERAQRQRGESVVITFSPHPREVVHGAEVPLLTTIEERADVLEKLGLDRLVVVEFTEAFSQLGAQEYVEEVLVERIGLQEIVIGYDHAFGRGREGNGALLEKLGAQHGFSVDVIPPQLVAEHVVSSSEVRRLLVEEGDVAGVQPLLGRPYSVTGTVIEGERRGRTIGFPTANLDVRHPRKVIPKEGVYAVEVYGARAGEAVGGMMNIGRRPTFSGTDVRIEVHLLDFEGDLYGQKLRTEFVDRLRDERPFASVEALTEQLSADRARCKQLFETLS